MQQKFGPINQPLINLLQRLRVIRAQSNLLPPLIRQMCSFDRLDIEVQSLIRRVCANGSVSRVGEGAGLAVTEARDIVFVAAEGLLGGFLVFAVAWQFELEGAELLVYYLPDYFVGRHGFPVGRGERCRISNWFGGPEIYLGRNDPRELRCQNSGPFWPKVFACTSTTSATTSSSMIRHIYCYNDGRLLIVRFPRRTYIKFLNSIARDRKPI